MLFFSIWLIPLSVIPLKSILSQMARFHFYDQIIFPLCIYTISLSTITSLYIYIHTQYILVLMGTLQLFPHLAYCICCGNEHRVYFIFSKLYFHILWISPQEAELNHMVILIIYWGIAILFIVAAPTYFPMNNIWDFFLSYILSNISFSFWLHLLGVQNFPDRDQTCTPCSRSKES